MEKILEKILNIPEETKDIEFKRIDGDGVVKRVIQTVAAMANTDGGVIILGIDDPEKTKMKGVERVFGIEENKENFDEIHQQLRSIRLPVSIEFSEISCGEKTVVLLTIQKSTDSFHTVSDEVWIRLQKSNKKLTPHEILQFDYAKGFRMADKELVDDVKIDLLDTEHYRTWKERGGLDPENKGIEHVLRSKGLVREDDGVLKPTRAAVLLFAEHPTHLTDMKCAIKIMTYHGNEEEYHETPNFFKVPKLVQGPVHKMIAEAQEYVLDLLSGGVEISSGFRTTFKLPERAVKEGITNAVIHRDYYTK
ncbi:MAG: putative DNA binding domain-containing protein [Candidatus Kaiserbacteria bacterium]|nr:putative DNA binding domain-containing protein [Candidatus Kaiserbacteria bacterium]